jgi:hypothetical protein
MKKIIVLSWKINLPRFLFFSKKQVSGPQYTSTIDRYVIEDSGDRSSQLLPEVGECNLAVALLQFEAERAKSQVVV